MLNFSKAGAGIQIPPPSTRILEAWGLREKLEAVVCKPKTFTLRKYQDGQVIGSIPLNPFCEEHYGAQWWTIHRADYQKILFKEAVNCGAEVKLDHRLVHVDVSTATVTVQVEDITKKHQADLVIGADGLRSQVRSTILDEEYANPRPSKICAYRALVPLEAMNADDLRKPLIQPENDKVEVWLGPERMVLSYPIRQGPSAQYNLVLVHPEKIDPANNGKPVRFPRPALVSEVSGHYSDFCPQVKSIVSVVTPEDKNDYFIKQAALDPKDGILQWKLADLSQLPTWSSENGRVVLVGDAAHAQRPFLSAGASTSLEDAVALGVFLDLKAVQRYDLRRLVQAFVGLRRGRASKMQAMSAADSSAWLMPDGKAQQRRDVLLKHLGDEDRQSCARAMAQLKAEGIGEFNFGDADFMDWAWGYDVLQDARQTLKSLENKESRNSKLKSVL